MAKDKFTDFKEDVKDTFKPESKKDEEEQKFRERVQKYSVCGSCLGQFNTLPVVEKAKVKYEKQEVFQAQHPEHREDDVRVYILKREQQKDEPPLPESKFIVEIPAKYTE